MDYATASSGFSYKMKTRVQVSGRTLNIKVKYRASTDNRLDVDYVVSTENLVNGLTYARCHHAMESIES